MLIAGTDKVTLARLYSFLKTESNVYVQAPGCDKELDKLAAKFVENPSNRQNILKECEAAIEKIECEKVNDLKCSN